MLLQLLGDCTGQDVMESARAALASRAQQGVMSQLNAWEGGGTVPAGMCGCLLRL